MFYLWYVILTLRQLRRLIREWAGAPPTKPMFDYVNNPLSPSTNDREQLGPLADHPADVDPNDDDELPTHLRDPQEDPKDCWGPVPPDVPDPYVQQDPFTRDTGVLPSSPIKR